MASRAASSAWSSVALLACPSARRVSTRGIANADASDSSAISLINDRALVKPIHPLLLLLVLLAVFGRFHASIAAKLAVSASLLGSLLVVLVCALAASWYAADSRARGVPFSAGMALGVALLPAVAIPLHINRTRRADERAAAYVGLGVFLVAAILVYRFCFP